MKLTAQLDVDMLALEQEDEVTCLLAFDAPPSPVTEQESDQPGNVLVFVVDRSGSMNGDPLHAVKTSLRAVVDRLRPTDAFGVVTFDSRAEIAVPIRRMADHDRATVHALIERITPGGSTDLSAGYLLGLAEARRSMGPAGASIVVLSDGHANAGIRDTASLGGLATQAADDGISTATIGLGKGYDETLLAHLATAGRGSHRFAATPDDAIAVVSQEAGDLLSTSIINAFVRIRPEVPELIERLTLHHDLPCWNATDPDGSVVVVIALGDLYAEEHRELLVSFSVPALGEVGPRHLLTFSIEYVTVPALIAETITWPVNVNIVPGSEAAQRVPNPVVRTARLLIDATKAKKNAVEALVLGDTDTASRLMEAQAAELTQAIAGCDDSDLQGQQLRARLEEEGNQARKLARAAREHEAMLAAKSFTEDIQMEMTGRNDQHKRQRARNRREY